MFRALARLINRLPDGTPPLPPREHELEAPYLSVRIVPRGTNSFAVEEYGIKGLKGRNSYYTWDTLFDGLTKEAAEAKAREHLQARADEAARARADEEAIRAHREANPPRIITLES